jgi:hypothetical protein
MNCDGKKGCRSKEYEDKALPRPYILSTYFGMVITDHAKSNIGLESNITKKSNRKNK